MQKYKTRKHQIFSKQAPSPKRALKTTGAANLQIHWRSQFRRIGFRKPNSSQGSTRSNEDSVRGDRNSLRQKEPPPRKDYSSAPSIGRRLQRCLQCSIRCGARQDARVSLAIDNGKDPTRPRPGRKDRDGRYSRPFCALEEGHRNKGAGAWSGAIGRISVRPVSAEGM